MKLSVFFTVTDPLQRGDLFYESLASYGSIADEIIMVDGSTPPLMNDGMHEVQDQSLILVNHPWSQEFDWPFIGQQFQRGYVAATGDWVIHADSDFIFHEKDAIAIRNACLKHDNAPALSFWKYQIFTADRYNLKSRLVIAVNKRKYGDRIKFNSGGDLCQPSLDGREIKSDDVPEARVPFFNYEKILKTKAQIARDQGRMERAYYRHFNQYQLSQDGSDESAFTGWWQMVSGRYRNHLGKLEMSDHPQVMQSTLKNLQPNQFGYCAFGLGGDLC